MGLNVLSDRPVVLHGLGVEGRAACDALAGSGADLTIVDPGVPDTTPADIVRFAPDTLYLRSPGIPPTEPLHARALASGCTVTTPTGWWLATLAPPGTITVTGTKGKSTTTAMLSAILAAGGVSSAAYGNIGAPPLGPHLPREAAPVVELSSYMCQDLLPPSDGRRWFHLVTSLYKEHTDWHGGEAAYRAAKLRPFRFAPPCPGAAPRAVIASEGLSVTNLEAALPLEGASLALAGGIDLRALNDAFASPAATLALRAAAVAAAPLLGAGLADAVRAAAARWRGLPSRQAQIPSTDGRVWIDDALATVPEATRAALVRFGDRPVRIVLGGKDRGQDYSELAAIIGSLPDAHAYGFGEVAAKLEKVGVAVFATIEDAVRAAARDCPVGGIVLFSPAAPSGPPHRDYKARAAIFAAMAAGT